MSKFIHKSHNVTVLLYHIVCPAKYRRVVFSDTVDARLKEVCLEISKRYEIHFLEIGTDKDHVHFLVSIPPKMSVGSVIRIIKANTSRGLKEKFPFLKEVYWGTDGIWSDGYCVSTVGLNEAMIRKYIENQGKEDAGQATLELS